MAKKMIRVAPSLLACNFNEIGKEVSKVIAAKADWLHLDIMDGTFVPNISFGIPICNAVKEFPIFKDVHLMIANPLEYIKNFIDEGADLVTFHLEAIKTKKDTKAAIKLIHEYGVAAGIAINPDTPVTDVLPFIKDLDVILVMSVNPGFGGQTFNNIAIDKIKFLRKYIDDNNLECFIEVDGGINDATAPLVKDAGVDILVSGNYLFKENMKEKVKLLKK